MIYLVSISALVLLIYVLISIWKNKRLPASLSATYYMYPKWIFPVIIIFSAGTLLPCWLQITEGNNLQFLSFIACAGLMFVGLSPNYKNDEDDNKVHHIAAYLATSCAIISVSFLVEGCLYLLIASIIIYFGLHIKYIKSSYIFLLEIAVLTVTYIIVIMCLLDRYIIY